MATRRFGVWLVLLLTPVHSHAQSPITIEQLLVQSERWQLTNSLELRAGESVPGISRSQSSWSTGLRYGLNSRFELNMRVDRSQFSQNTPAGNSREQTTRFSAGVNWLMLRESKWPAILFQGRSEVYSSTAGQTRNLPAAQIGFTAYKSIDPIVLSLSALLQHERDYALRAAPGSDDRTRVEPGSAWHVEPAINFAVNPQITLLGAMGFTERSPLRVDGVAGAAGERRVSLRLGVGYAPAPGHSIFLNGDMSSSAGGGLNLRWFWEF